MKDNGVAPPTITYDISTTLTSIKFRYRDIARRLRKLDTSKSTGPDGISATVLKECADELAPSLSKIFSFSFNAGCLPEEWKYSNVCPIHKKGSKSAPENYRPISLLCIAGKVMEGIINTQLRSHLLQNDLIHDHQFGFRPKCSALDALSLATQKWEDALDKGKEIRVVSLDISRAFDKVWHPGLIAKLKAAGIGGNLLSWLISFLSGRSQRVVVEGESSSSLSIGAGVPQGRILGPTLFLLFINDLQEIFKNKVVMFADDTTLYSVVDSKKEREAVSVSLNEDLRRVEEWAKQWFVTFNANKTQGLVISRCRDNNSHPPLFFLGSQVQDVDSIKFLGLTIEGKLSWSNHVASLSKKAGRRTGLLKKASQVLPQSLLLQYYKQSIRSIMEQYCPIWNGAPKRDLHFLDSIQKKCFRVCGVSNKDLGKMRLHPLSHRRDVAGLSTFYKIQMGIAPPALQDINPPTFVSRKPTRLDGNLSSGGVVVPFSRTSHHQMSYIPSFSRKWNSLPANLIDRRNVVNLNSFRKKANSYLMSV